ncbi:hypothetical protein AK830_g12038 [Neonectria ditissima]|uniref:DUF2415 domain-containing protein n=1 Tax=Neonectria ditissima TaxID=78410 RepID=A0A0P7B1H7_9HYPO|nr:hypothetical protein AK830_g12038 [Neonectria ditissima]
MAVKDEGDIHPTEFLISQRARKHYRIPVRSQHWQLRSLVSAEKDNIVYFPGGTGSNHVQRLNTATRECETLKLLTFAPRCLVAENGWLCCGSESGEFVAIRLDDETDCNDRADPVDRADHADHADHTDHTDRADHIDRSERLLPSNALAALRPDVTTPGAGPDSSRNDSVFSLLSRARRPNKSLIAKSMKLAKDRVNCITLWFPPTSLPACDKAYDEPLAILANNDRTVTLVSLEDFEKNEKTEPLDVITYPDFVNRAIISPNGRFLVSVLDDPYMYVHQRVKAIPESASTRSVEATEYQWEQTQRILLKSQRKDDRSDSRGSFAACFSSSGAYLAVGTQHGTISIFNATLLDNPDADPLITTFQSSRPQSGPGAVRDMAFCPGPFDILAWTEDRGNVGIIDMRSNFVVRQIINIDDPTFEHISVVDRNTIDPRLLESRRDRRSNVSASASANNNTTNSTEGRRRGADGIDSLNSPLTANETLVLEAIQNDRRRRDRTAPRTAAEERATPLTNSFWADRTTRRTAANDDTQRPSERRSSSIGRTMSDLLGTYRSQDRARNARQLLRDAAEIGETSRPPDRWMESLGETVAMLREQRQRQDSSYLTVLEILQARERSSDRDPDDSSVLGPLVNQVVTRWEESALRGTLATDHGVFEVPPSPDNTAGLAWSEDGRVLFVGAQNGIYELHLNVQSRKLCPSISMR